MNRTNHRQFFNQLYSGFNLPAYIGELFATLTNTSMYTHEVAPVATLIEKEMISLMKSYVGFSDGDGLFVTGGSNANMIALFSARNKYYPQIRYDGYPAGLKLRAFVSDQAHYSFDIAANLLGIGANGLLRVKSDAQGRMLPAELKSALEASLERGETPFFVGATCGTTVLGAYDPIPEIVQVCKNFDVWVHGDGAFGGSLLLSPEHRYLMEGIDELDSFAWDAHKLMNIPLVCSVILMKDEEVLANNLTDINTEYLYHGEDEGDDLGRKSIQCGRRVDAVKLWFSWKYYGIEGYENRINTLMRLSQYAEGIVNRTPELSMTVDRQSFAVCFHYVSPNNADREEINLRLREELIQSGLSMVNYGYHNDEMVIRLVVSNGELEEKDIDEFFSNLLCVAKKMEASVPA